MTDFNYVRTRAGIILLLRKIISLLNNQVYNKWNDTEKCDMDLSYYYNYLNGDINDNVYQTYKDDWFNLLIEYLNSKNNTNDKSCNISYSVVPVVSNITSIPSAPSNKSKTKSKRLGGKMNKRSLKNNKISNKISNKGYIKLSKKNTMKKVNVSRRNL